MTACRCNCFEKVPDTLLGNLAALAPKRPSACACQAAMRPPLGVVQQLQLSILCAARVLQVTIEQKGKGHIGYMRLRSWVPLRNAIDATEGDVVRVMPTKKACF